MIPALSTGRCRTSRTEPLKPAPRPLPLAKIALFRIPLLVLAAAASAVPSRGEASQAGSAPQTPAPIVRVPPVRQPARDASPVQTPVTPAPRRTPAVTPGTIPADTSSSAAPEHKPAVVEHATERATEHRAGATINGLNRAVVVLDPGEGGVNAGARIDDSTVEKNVTLALALRLRSLLLARGFTVVLTRDSDAAVMQTTATSTPTPLTLDDRAGIANHAHASACLLLHATGRGSGVHLYGSEMAPIPAQPALIPWLTGQAAWIPASRSLEAQLGAALDRSHIPRVTGTASIRPADSLTCPALVLELAPAIAGKPSTINDAGYQGRVVAALAGALVVWENAVQPPPRLSAPVRPHTAAAHRPVAPVTPAPTTTTDGQP